MLNGAYRNSSERENIEAEAARLFHQAHASQCDADWDNAYAWVELDPTHGVAFAKAEASWELAKKLRESPPEIGSEAVAGPAGWLEARLEPLLGRRAMAGFIAATIFGIGGVAMLQKVTAVDRYRTVIGEERSIRLEDGSFVHLNTDTSIEVGMHARERDVRLLRGEARFDVAHDAGRPFIVSAGGSSVRAVGTAFTVRIRSEFTELTVIQGKVAVRDGPQPAMMVTAGTAAAIRGGTIATTRLVPEQIAQRISWQQGMLSFAGETLAQAVEDFNRYRRVPLVIGDPQIASIRIGGTFKANNSDQFVSALEQGFGVRAVRGSDAVLLLPAATSPEGLDGVPNSDRF